MFWGAAGRTDPSQKREPSPSRFLYIRLATVIRTCGRRWLSSWRAPAHSHSDYNLNRFFCATSESSDCLIPSRGRNEVDRPLANVAQRAGEGTNGPVGFSGRGKYTTQRAGLTTITYLLENWKSADPSGLRVRSNRFTPAHPTHPPTHTIPRHLRLILCLEVRGAF